jgi:glycosyltransferase involved in cell wall biosynthesis
VAPVISVVVPTYAQALRLDACLAALSEQNLSNRYYEVIVVDDCSSDDTAAVIAKHVTANPHFRGFRHDVNQGQGGARHTGAQSARGRIILFVDGDLQADVDYVETHLRRHEEGGGERLAVIGNIRYHEDYIRGSNFARYVNSRYLGCRSSRQRSGLDFEDLSPKYCGSGIVSVRRDDYFASGGFDHRVTRYGWEDVDFGIRLKRQGIRIVFTENAHVRHLDYASISRMKVKALEMGRESARVLVTHNPDAFKLTWYQYLLPQGVLDASIRSRLIKVALHGFLNKTVWTMIEGWCRRTDGYSLCYMPFIYKLVQAAWFMEGTRQKATGRSDVYRQ